MNWNSCVKPGNQDMNWSDAYTSAQKRQRGDIGKQERKRAQANARQEAEVKRVKNMREHMTEDRVWREKSEKKYPYTLQTQEDMVSLGAEPHCSFGIVPRIPASQRSGYIGYKYNPNEYLGNQSIWGGEVEREHIQQTCGVDGAMPNVTVFGDNVANPPDAVWKLRRLEEAGLDI